MATKPEQEKQAKKVIAVVKLTNGKVSVFHKKKQINIVKRVTEFKFDPELLKTFEATKELKINVK